MDAAAGRILLRRVLVSAGFAVAAVAGYELFAQPASAAPAIDQQPLTGAVGVDVVAVVQGLLPVPPLTPPPLTPPLALPSLPVLGLPSLAQRPEGAPAPNLDVSAVAGDSEGGSLVRAAVGPGPSDPSSARHSSIGGQAPVGSSPVGQSSPASPSPPVPPPAVGGWPATSGGGHHRSVDDGRPAFAIADPMILSCSPVAGRRGLPSQAAARPPVRPG